MKPSDSSEDFTAQFKKDINRISIPLKLLETSDTTLRHAQIQQSLKNNGHHLTILRQINKGLYILIILAAVYFLLVAAFWGRRGLTINEEHLGLPPERTAGAALDAGAKWNELEHAMERRSIFEPLAILAQAEKNAFEQEILQRIRIVGVMLDESPKAIIEVIASGETVFVSKGDTVTGAIVKDIFENKVVLTYNGLELELLR